MRQAVDEVEVDGGEPGFAHPIERLLGHARAAGCDAPLPGPSGSKSCTPREARLKADFAQGDDVVAGQAARIDFHAGFDIVGESEMAVDDLAEPADFVGRKKGWRAAAPMELGDFAPRIEQRAPSAPFLFRDNRCKSGPGCD